MEMSDHGCSLLTQWEGFRNTEYKDAAGLPTIGVGHLLTPAECSAGCVAINGDSVSCSGGLTDSQVQDLLKQDLKRFEEAVTECVAVPIAQNQFDALVSFCFNVGIDDFKKSSLLKALNAGNFADVPDELRRWTSAGGQRVEGLVNRRENEIKLWFGEA
jgi:lysozyme